MHDSYCYGDLSHYYYFGGYENYESENSEYGLDFLYFNDCETIGLLQMFAEFDLMVDYLNVYCYVNDFIILFL